MKARIYTSTKLQNGRTVCGICGKQVDDKCETGEIFRDMDSVFDKMNSLFDRMAKLWSGK